jgi:hypothetical protein
MNRSYYPQAVTDAPPTARTISLGGFVVTLLAAAALVLAIVAVSHPVVAGVALLALGGALSLAGRR